jgi:hypothetical protein
MEDALDDLATYGSDKSKDLGDVISKEAADAKKAGYRYLYFYHGDGIEEFVSLYPAEDLKIIDR